MNDRRIALLVTLAFAATVVGAFLVAWSAS